MRKAAWVFWMLLVPWLAATAQVSIGIGLPNLSIGIHLPVYPELVRVPGYPVYYAPRLDANYFFYDGLYWVYQDDTWYASTWYDGPWSTVAPHGVPLFVLRIPVRYYRQPPPYFRGWQREAPPRWGEHWGDAWQQRRPGWDRWDRRATPPPAPLPTYQREFRGERYPQAVDRQQALHDRRYRYQPRDDIVRQRVEQQRQALPPRAARDTPPRRAAGPGNDRRDDTRDHKRDEKRDEKGRDHGNERKP